MELKRFSFSTNAFSRHSLHHALKRISDAGFRSVEILADKPHVWMDIFTSSDLDRLQKQLRRLDLTVSNINAENTSGFWSDAPPELFSEPSLVSRVREYREWRIAYTKKALRLGQALGAKSVSVTSGRALNGVPPESATKLLGEGLERLLEHAEKMGQRLALRPAQTMLIESTNELAELIKTVGSNRFGACLDVAHAEVCGENPVVAIRKLKNSLFHIDLADIRDHKNYARLPGDGELNFDAIFKTLDDVGYDGSLTWDIRTSDEDPDAACKKTFKFSKSAK